MVPPVSALDSVMMSGTTPAASQANIVPVRPKPVKISSKISEQAVAVSGRAQTAQHLRLVEHHAAGALHQRLDDDAGEGFAFSSRKSSSAAMLASSRGRSQHGVLRQAAPAEEAVHALSGVAHRHRRQACRRDSRPGRREIVCGVRMPRLSQYCAAIFMATSTATEPESAKNTWSRSPGSMRRQPRGQLFGAGSCVRPPNMTCGMRLELARDRCADMRVVVAVAGGPPGGDAVDQYPPVVRG